TFRRNTGGGAVDVGYQFGQTGELRIGYEGGWQQYAREVGNPTLPTFSGAYGTTHVRYQLDRLDNAVVPRRGQFLQADWNWTNTAPVAPGAFPTLAAVSKNFFQISEPASIYLNGYGGTTFDFATGIPQFPLGGPTQFVAYGTNEL